MVGQRLTGQLDLAKMAGNPRSSQRDVFRHPHPDARLPVPGTKRLAGLCSPSTTLPFIDCPTCYRTNSTVRPCLQHYHPVSIVCGLLLSWSMRQVTPNDPTITPLHCHKNVRHFTYLPLFVMVEWKSFNSCFFKCKVFTEERVRRPLTLS